MILRIFLNIFIFLSILFFPWWITLGVVLIILAIYNAYEVIVLGIFADALYSVPLVDFFNIQFVFTIIFVSLLVVSSFLKKKVIFYNS